MTAARKVLVSGRDLEVTRLDYQLGDATALHLHDCEQVGWVESGRFLLTLGDKVTLYETGSAYVVPMRSIHKFEVLEPGIVYIVTSPRQRTFQA